MSQMTTEQVLYLMVPAAVVLIALWTGIRALRNRQRQIDRAVFHNDGADWRAVSAMSKRRNRSQ